MAARELITPAEYARRRGVSRPAVSKAIKRCAIPLTNGRLDPLVADTLWTARTDPDQQRRALGQQRQPEPPPGAPEVSIEAWRRRREAADAQRAELELRRAAGELVPRDEVLRELGKRITDISRQFDALPDRAAGALGVDVAHARKVRQFLRDELAQIMAAVADLGLKAA